MVEQGCQEAEPAAVPGGGGSIERQPVSSHSAAGVGQSGRSPMSHRMTDSLSSVTRRSQSVRPRWANLSTESMLWRCDSDVK